MHWIDHFTLDTGIPEEIFGGDWLLWKLCLWDFTKWTGCEKVCSSVWISSYKVN